MAKDFDPKKEIELITAAQGGDLHARREVHKLFNRALNDSVYNKYSNLTQPLPAIRMEAEQIFDKAINSFNPSVGVKPITYLKKYVDKKLTRYINDNATPVRVVEKFSTNIPKYKDAISVLSHDLGREPTDQEILVYMKKHNPTSNSIQSMRVNDVQRIKRDIRTTTFSSNTVGRSDEGSSITMEDMVFVQGKDDPMEDYIHDLQANEIHDKVMRLLEPYRTIVLHTYAFPGYPKLSLRDLALKLGINKYRVQEYLKEAEVMLKEPMN